MILAIGQLRHAADLRIGTDLIGRCASSRLATWLSPVSVQFTGPDAPLIKKLVEIRRPRCTMMVDREEWLRKVAQVWGRHLGREVTADEAIQIDAGMGALCRAFIETEKNLKQ